MRKLFFRVLAEADVPSNVEAPLQSLGITPPDDSPNSQRMDIYCVIDGHDYLLGVTITYPCRPDASTIPFHRTVNRRGAQLPGGKAAGLAEKEKIDKYGPAARAAGFRFVPLAKETFGRWGEKTMDFLKMLAKRKPRPTSIPADEDGAFRESVIKHWSQLLSVELTKHNAFQVASRAQRAAAARGPRRAHAFPEDSVSRGPYRPHTIPASVL
ncbi:unnamed protein product [Vitrella brassicaformis CCMP3155]|uniref:Uncharacterized protein n=1 Tax=Vitrella brassicaformis (strain CCMP3155) TaxID=1169540 RepID=A0A0G4GPE0_VITBC|nr:unnamed protein product [Vitrella brassicaformis CCMP3155]|eukprot:CEM32043.1 unnamed protein product [Vitrella brassicaformis CCMP3155]